MSKGSYDPMVVAAHRGKSPDRLLALDVDALNGEVRVNSLPTRFLSGRRPPRRDGRFGKPERQVASLPRTSLILWPISDAVALLRLHQLATVRASISRAVADALENNPLS